MDKPLIVVGTDGTPASEPALRWAAGQAGTHGRLLIVHAWEAATGHHASYARRPPAGDVLERRLAGRAVLDRAAAVATDACPGVSLECRLVPGRPETALLDVARGADMLVLGSVAQWAGDGRLGAVLLSCLRWPPCPVVVVPGVPQGRRPGLASPADQGLWRSRAVTFGTDRRPVPG